MNKGIPYDTFNEADNDILEISNFELSDDDKAKVSNIIKELRADSGMNTYQKGKNLKI